MPFIPFPSSIPFSLEPPSVSNSDSLILCFPAPNSVDAIVDLRINVYLRVYPEPPFQKTLINLGIKDYVHSQYYDADYEIILISLERLLAGDALSSFVISSYVDWVPSPIGIPQDNEHYNKIVVDWELLEKTYDGINGDSSAVYAFIAYSEVGGQSTVTYPTTPIPIDDLMSSHKPYIFSRYVKYALGIPKSSPNYNNAVGAVREMFNLYRNTNHAVLPEWFDKLSISLEVISADVVKQGSLLALLIDKTSNLSSLIADDSGRTVSTVIQRDIKKVFRQGNSVMTMNPELVVTSKGFELPRLKSFSLTERYAIASPSMHTRSSYSMPVDFEQGYPMVLHKDVTIMGSDAWVYYSGSSVPFLFQ